MGGAVIKRVVILTSMLSLFLLPFVMLAQLTGQWTVSMLIGVLFIIIMLVNCEKVVLLAFRARRLKRLDDNLSPIVTNLATRLGLGKVVIYSSGKFPKMFAAIDRPWLSSHAIVVGDSLLDKVSSQDKERLVLEALLRFKTGSAQILTFISVVFAILKLPLWVSSRKKRHMLLAAPFGLFEKVFHVFKVPMFVLEEFVVEEIASDRSNAGERVKIEHPSVDSFQIRVTSAPISIFGNSTSSIMAKNLSILKEDTGVSVFDFIKKDLPASRVN